jgi:sterol desaturase/sphingolipid hydroxylase (fatty acid hydroxylase superfamily)
MIEILYYIVCYDVWYYLSHIILHNKKIYKTIHREHHSTDYSKISYKDTYVGHIIEGPFQGIGVLFPLLLIKLNIKTLICSLIIINIRGMLKHDKQFIWLIGNHHILHHKYPKYNYGEYWLDKLLGTDYPNKNEYMYGMIYI